MTSTAEPQQTRSAPPTLGFIGLGDMGNPMAQHLLRAGHALHVWARSEHRLPPLVAAGNCQPHLDSASLFRHCSLVFLNVTTTDDVDELLFGANGAAHHCAPGALIVDFSTIDSGQARCFAQRLSAQYQIDYLDCPVSGGATGAQSASLTIMAGGIPTAFERAKPYLTLLGQTIEHVGPSGSGQAIKAANQMAMCIQLAGLAEAFSYAETQGADLKACLRLLSAGLAGSKVLDWAGPHMIEDLDRPATIQARLHAKDMSMIARSARENKLHLPLTEQTTALLESMMAQGWGNSDTARVIELVKTRLRTGD